MLIRNRQMDSLRRKREQQFADKLASIIRNSLPEYFLHLTQDEGRSLILQLADDGRSFGLETERDIGNYVQLRLEHESFNDDIENDENLKQIIAREDIDASRKLNLIIQKLTTLE